MHPLRQRLQLTMPPCNPISLLEHRWLIIDGPMMKDSETLNKWSTVMKVKDLKGMISGKKSDAHLLVNHTFAKKLRALDGYEIVFICDDSGSMNTPLGRFVMIVNDVHRSLI